MEFVRWLKCLNPWTKSYGVIIQMRAIVDNARICSSELLVWLNVKTSLSNCIYFEQSINVDEIGLLSSLDVAIHAVNFYTNY